MSDQWRVVPNPSREHVWQGPVRVGDRCLCGERIITQTVATGTMDGGLSVVSWHTDPATDTGGQAP